MTSVSISWSVSVNRSAYVAFVVKLFSVANASRIFYAHYTLVNQYRPANDMMNKRSLEAQFGRDGVSVKVPGKNSFWVQS